MIFQDLTKMAQVAFSVRVWPRESERDAGGEFQAWKALGDCSNHPGPEKHIFTSRLSLSLSHHLPSVSSHPLQQDVCASRHLVANPADDTHLNELLGVHNIRRNTSFNKRCLLIRIHVRFAKPFCPRPPPSQIPPYLWPAFPICSLVHFSAPRALSAPSSIQYSACPP